MSASLNEAAVKSASRGFHPTERQLRLLRYAAELGVSDAVEVRHEVPYREMPAIYASASAMVLASLPVWSWEEQFGMVLAEAMCCGLPVIAADSGAIAEVMTGAATLVAPQDWRGLARALADGPLASPPGARASYDDALLDRYSESAAAASLASAYADVLATR